MRPKNTDEFRKSLADSFLKVLEEKGSAWQKDWNLGGSDAPQNGVTGKRYKGMNAFSLALLCSQKGYTDPRFVTMVQIMDKKHLYHPGKNWHLKAGSKATYVEYWYMKDKEANKAVTWEEYRNALAEGREPTDFYLNSRYTAVFNASEVEGIEPYVRQEIEPIEPEQYVTDVVTGMEVSLLYDGGEDAYYEPETDEVHVPRPEGFSTPYGFYATVLHELAHATGSGSRLKRDQDCPFGSEGYAYEELVAEMAACFSSVHLNAELTPKHLENHKAYVKAWMKVLRENPEMLAKAIKDAESAAKYMDYTAGLIPEKEYEMHLKSYGEKKIARDVPER